MSSPLWTPNRRTFTGSGTASAVSKRNGLSSQPPTLPTQYYVTAGIRHGSDRIIPAWQRHASLGVALIVLYVTATPNQQTFEAAGVYPRYNAIHARSKVQVAGQGTKLYRLTTSYVRSTLHIKIIINHSVSS